MLGQTPLDLKLDKLPKHALAADIVYIPLEMQAHAAIKAFLAKHGLTSAVSAN
jgi:hypothetical protein